jgi:multisubunit Na+/H+ antiporter MnhF subunit
MDRIVAAAAGMAATLYFLAGCLAWWRWIFSTPAGPRRRATDAVIPDRAVAWSALCVLFVLIGLAKLGRVNWSDAVVDMALAVGLMAVWAAGIVSVRIITAPRYGYRAVAVFAGVSIAIGLLIPLL